MAKAQAREAAGGAEAPEAAKAAAASVLTVQRGMQVLRAFQSDPLPLGNAELVRRTGLPKATVSRLTTTLLHLGYLRHVPDGRRFELTVAPLAMGHAYAATSALVERAGPFLQALADRFEVNAALALPDGLDMLYVGFRAGQHTATLRYGVGSLVPMGQTAIGRAYLWGLPPRERQRLVATLLRQAGAQAGQTEAGIAQAFDELDRTGLCGVFGTFRRYTFGIALPVRIGREGTLMAMSFGNVTLDSSAARETRRLGPTLLAAAPELETLLADLDDFV